MQEALFEFALPGQDGGRTGRVPTDDEVGRAVLKATRMAVRKRLRGHCPPDLDRDDLAQEVAILSLPYVRRWRETGKRTLLEYAYCTACNRLTDYFRDRARARAKKDVDDQDVMDRQGLLPLDEARDAMPEAC